MYRGKIETKDCIDELISVVVPVYKVETSLEKCVNSIRMQSYKNIEIILVDDGSPDSCGDMCERIALCDARIKVLHKENGGLSDARNFGILHSKGKYIGFVDSDDYIEPDMYKKLVYALKQTNSDISTCFSKDELEGCPSGSLEKSNDYVVLDKYEALMDLFLENNFLRHAVWNKLYNRKIFVKYSFPKGRLFEDASIMYRIINDSRRIVCINSEEYHYVQRIGSISNSSYNSKSIIDRIQNGCEAVDFFSEEKPFEMAAVEWNINKFPQLYETAYFNRDKETSEYVLKKYKKMVSLYKSMYKMRKNEKGFKEKMFMLNPKLYCFLKKIKNRTDK